MARAVTCPEANRPIASSRYHGPMTGRCVYVFGHGGLEFAEFLELYAPPIEAALADDTTTWAVCDFRGVDTLAMEYLKARTRAVTVFHVGTRPRYFPDRRAANVAHWQLRGGFADDDARDNAALAIATHFLAVDRFSTPKRTSGTGRIIERALAAGCHPLLVDPARASAMGRARAAIDRLPVHETARAFAHLLLDLFPPWFDFAPAHLAVLRWQLGVHLVVSGPGTDRHAPVVLISTSDSRNMKIAVHTSAHATGQVADLSMPYVPGPSDRVRAQVMISLALRALFPAEPLAPEAAALAATLPADRLFAVRWPEDDDRR